MRALEDGVPDVTVGGPETLTRRQELELALAAAGRPPRVRRVPAPLTRALVAVLRPVDPRRAAMVDFARRVWSIDMVGPPHGERTLADHLRERAGQSS